MAVQRGERLRAGARVPELHHGVLRPRGDHAVGRVPVAGLHVPPVPRHCRLRLRCLEVPYLPDSYDAQSSAVHSLLQHQLWALTAQVVASLMGLAHAKNSLS